DLIDTAGLRKKGKVFEAVEKFSVVKTLQAIADAHVVLLLLDATQGVTDQDAHIAGYILESGRAVVVAANKLDAVDAYQQEQLEHVTDAYKRFLEGRIRDHFKLSGTPLRIEMRSSKNPFVERRG